MRKAVFFVTVALFLFGCAFPDTIYREGASQDYVCLDAKPIALTSQNDEKDTLAPQVIKCASQTHIVGENGGIPFLKYQLEFMQFSQLGKPLLKNREEEIRQLLNNKDDKQNIIIVFVHGWRHDADIGDRDVKRFRTLLAYTASFLQQRCRGNSRYCGAKLTGIYVLFSPVGDLVVLINPASEARKWTSIQQALRSKLGISGSASTAEDSHKAFPVDQRPVYMSITSACSWSSAPGADLRDPSDKSEIREINCDTVTGQIFPIAQHVAGNFDIESLTTIGHLDPTQQRRTGTTHEIEINGSVGKNTEYFNALKEDLSQCLVADGWLRKARERSKNMANPEDRCATGCNWDAGFEAPSKGGENTALARLIHPTAARL